MSAKGVLAGGKRKRAPRLSRQEREAEILARAREVFERSGYERSTVAEIAAELGLVEGTVFHYFPSKRALMLRVIETFYEQITAELEQGIASVRGTRNRLHFVIHFHLGTITRSADFCAVILRESRGVEPAFAGEIHRLNRLYTGILVQIVKEGISAGEIKASVSPALVRNTVYGNIEHLLWDIVAERKPVDVDKVSEDLTEMVFRGISTDGAGPDRSEIAALVKKLNRLLG